MGDEIPHMGVIHGPLGLGLPGVEGLGVIRVDADDMDRRHVAEHVLAGIDKLAAKHEMQALGHPILRGRRCCAAT
jgi:hypothetical protein